jgi:bilirubin oxidase
MTTNFSQLICIGALLATSNLKAQYTKLHIPDTLSGTHFNLVLKDTFTQYKTGQTTITSGINGNFWGPTIFINKGDTVFMNVLNKLNDSTTIHWHGFHLPAVMDGGPHQVIPPNTVWRPYWKVKNDAATYWYHPHLHEMTQEHLTKGLGGLIIVRDAVESALQLPRSYGVDDIPVVLTSRRYSASNQFVVKKCSYGDYLFTNGTPNAEYTIPKQVVRLRILNAEMERGFNIGFSDNRTFYVINSGGGLFDKPVAVTRLPIHVGERYEILVDCNSDAVGSTLDLMAYNSGQSQSFPGGEPATGGEFGSLLNNINFKILHLTIGNKTANATVSIPNTLTTNSYLTAADATLSRTVNITNGIPGSGIPFDLDGKPFSLNTINHTLITETTEKWTIKNNNVFGHCFHIHDVQFKLISRSTGAIGAYESGWKDAFFISRNESVSFVAKFIDYADETHPFMYHCHFSNHEDGGMMGQFVVTGTNDVQSVQNKSFLFSVYPNPTSNSISLKLSENIEAYYVTIHNVVGKTVMMLPQPEIHKPIDISNLSNGTYIIQVMDKNTKSISVEKFIKR